MKTALSDAYALEDFEKAKALLERQEVYSEWKCTGAANDQPHAMTYLDLRCTSAP
jgi:hypothetical protein